MSYVVVGLSDPCEEYPGHDCVSWVHGPFETRREAGEHAGAVPAGFRPHILSLEDTSPVPDWKRGDRVMVCLPDKGGVKGGVNSHAWFGGTVREVDPPGRRPGVIVDLDYPVNGVGDCYATHAELRAPAN